jgi:glutathione gamma-glutamylcysteinyltransferase
MIKFLTGHPAFCGIGSLTMSLNSLLLDPKRVWQGVWRWFDESMLSCCEPLDVVKLKGITLAKLGCLAKCNGAKTIIKYGSNVSIDEFRQDVSLIASLPVGIDHTIMIVSYNRGTLKQSGSGHFSPVGKFNLSIEKIFLNFKNSQAVTVPRRTWF